MSITKPVILLMALGFSFICQAQNSLSEQYEDIMNTSNNYQDFKVVKKNRLDIFQKNVSDSIALYRNALDQMQAEIESQQIENGLVKNSLEEVQVELQQTKENADGIYFLGMLLSKSVYNTIVWLLIALLTILLIAFISKFKKSNRVTTSLKEKLAETEEEFEVHRQRALEREQQLNRKLLDETNKKKS